MHHKDYIHSNISIALGDIIYQTDVLFLIIQQPYYYTCIANRPVRQMMYLKMLTSIVQVQLPQRLGKSPRVKAVRIKVPALQEL